MLDYDTWMKNKEECQNYDMRPWCKMTEPARIAMKNAHAAGAGIEGIGLDGLWFRAPEPRWHKGNIYRVPPSWPGPAKPEPVPEPECEDKMHTMLGSDTTRCGNAAVWAELKKLWVVVRKATERNGNLSVELAAVTQERDALRREVAAQSRYLLDNVHPSFEAMRKEAGV